MGRLIAALLILANVFCAASVAQAQSMCPDGSFVARGPCQLTPDGRYIDYSRRGNQMAPDGTFVPDYGRGVQMAPDGTFHPGGRNLTMCPDGSFVVGRCVMAPDGRFIGR